MINLPKILRDPVLKRNFPKQLGEYEPPTVINKLNDTIHSKIFNFGKFVETVDIEEFVKDKTFSVMLKLLGALKIQKFNLTQVFRTKY